jgi:hypothetical protein
MKRSLTYIYSKLLEALGIMNIILYRMRVTNRPRPTGKEIFDEMISLDRERSDILTAFTKVRGDSFTSYLDLNENITRKELKQIKKILDSDDKP